MTRQKTLVWLIVVALAATIAFISGFEAEATDARRHVIEIRSFKFVPEVPDVSPGDVVVWKNMDLVPHTVTSKDDSWNSGLIAAGGEWEAVIFNDMVQDYFCGFHPVMTGRLAIE